MKLHRIQVKYFLDEPSTVDLAAIVPVFHRWIQDQAFDELLIDVANYSHVADGPGVILIAHEADYAIDSGRGRPGLLYTRKRSVPETTANALSLALQHVLRAAALLEDESSLGYRFNTREVEFIFPDRLRVPNRRESLDLVLEDVTSVLSGLYGTEEVTVQWTEDDERLPFGVRALLPSSPRPSDLAQRVELSQ